MKTNVSVKSKVLSKWRQHWENWVECDRCPLHKTRRNVVLVRGQLPCELLFIGEAPGESEDSLGYPFVGPAGEEFELIMIEALGDRKIRYAITNIIACAPYVESETTSRRIRAPHKVEMNACRPRLDEFLRIARPKTIITLGQTALNHFVLPPDKIGVKVLPIPHPAAIVRQRESRPQQADMMFQKSVIRIRRELERLNG